MKTYRFKLYWSERNEKLHEQVDAKGFIYNHCMAFYERYYKIFGKYLNRNQLQKHLVKLKKVDKFSYIKEISSQAVQDITDRIDRAFQLFFSNLKRNVRCSPPNFRKETVTIKRDSLDEIYVCIVTDAKDFVVETRTGERVGFDFGLKNFLTASNEKT